MTFSYTTEAKKLSFHAKLRFRASSTTSSPPPPFPEKESVTKKSRVERVFRAEISRDEEGESLTNCGGALTTNIATGSRARKRDETQLRAQASHDASPV